jgi:hypothetical protein
METITGMVDPLGQIVRECEAGNVAWKSVALTYAFGLRQEPKADWTAANEAIRARFKSDKDPTGIKALEKVKNLALDYLEGRKTPGGGR